MKNFEMFPLSVTELAIKIGMFLKTKNWRIVTAESCTGGGIVSTLTDIPGSSQWCEGGLITYSNNMKTTHLGVNNEILKNYGAVNQEVVICMVKGAIDNSDANVAIAVSGIAGPNGSQLPVGSVWFAWQLPNIETVVKFVSLSGDRQQIRSKSVYIALQGLCFLFSKHDLDKD